MQKYLFILSIISILLFGSVTGQAAKPVKITGSSGLAWDIHGEVLTVTGDVHLVYADFSLDCQRLVIDSEEKTIQAFEVTNYQKGTDQIAADYFEYDYSAEQGRFTRASAVFSSDSFATKAYLSGKDLITKGEDALVTSAFFSGCELPEPHYHFEAAELEYYPEDKLIARKVSYFEGQVRLFTLPYLLVSLKKSRWETPKIGYNSEDGWYVKTTYNYYRNPNSFGALFLDYYQKKGWGTGFRHEYQWEQFIPVAGWFYYYLKQNGFHDEPLDYHTALTVQPELPKDWAAHFQGEYKSDFHQGEVKKDWGGRASLAWSQENQRIKLDYDLLNKNTSPLYPGSIYQRTRAGLAYEHRPRQDFRYALSGTFFTQQRVDYPRQDPSTFFQAWANQTFTDYTLQLKAEHKYNPVYSADEEVPPWKSYTILPELRLTTRRLKWGQRILPLQASLSASRLQENPGKLSTLRAVGQLSLTGLNYRPTPGGSLNITGNVSGSYYDTNHGQYQMSTRSIFRQQLSSAFRGTLTHSWTGRVGVSPLTYDLTQPAHLLQARLDYTHAKWRGGISTGYNLRTAESEDLLTELSFRHGQQVYSSARAAYGLPEGEWKYVKFSVNYLTSPETEFRASVYYDFSQELWETVALEGRYRLDQNWLLETEIDWDGTYGGRLRSGRVGLTRDLHCRELKISVDAVREEIWFELIFKLLPGEPLRLGASDQKFLVDLEFLEGEV